MPIDPLISRDDPSIPVLTEVIDVPAVAPAAQADATAPLPLIQQAVDVPRSGGLVDETQFNNMRTALLEDVHRRIEPILRARMQQHVAAAVDRVMDDVADQLRNEISRMLDEGLNKELIRQTAVVEQQRPRPRTDDPLP
jgi:hypothetical protein